MFEHLTETLVQNNIIPQEESQLYLFGLKQCFYHTVSVLSMLTISLLFHTFWQAVIFLLAFAPMRIFAGGYHAKTQLRCFFITNITIALVLCAYNYIVWTSFSLVVIALFATAVIWVFAPVEDPNKPLDEIEKRVYKRRTRALIMMELVVLFISIMAELTLVAVLITFAMLVVSIVLIIGEVKLSFCKA